MERQRQPAGHRNSVGSTLMNQTLGPRSHTSRTRKGLEAKVSTPSSIARQAQQLLDQHDAERAHLNRAHDLNRRAQQAHLRRRLAERGGGSFVKRTPSSQQRFISQTNREIEQLADAQEAERILQEFAEEQEAAGRSNQRVREEQERHLQAKLNARRRMLQAGVLERVALFHARRDSACGTLFFQIERRCIAQLRPGSSFLLSAPRWP